MVYNQLKLQSQLCFRLYTASRLVTQTYYPLLDELGLTYPQYLVLMALWEEDHQKVMALAHRLYLDSNTMTPLLQRMAQLGLVERVKGERDGRETFVSLTEHGKELQEKAKDIPSCMVNKLFEDEEELNRFKEIALDLDRLIAHLAEQRAKEKEAVMEKMREERLASKRRRR
ncbi:MarR family transcriptional regulator [Prevotella sp. oral taxon 313]|uniref:MarR family winged helix-turn-helix transcriptional regulator n=1 Tax=Prevotella sp. oral taxon 313 TaxID=652722 RepID=UPI000D1F9EBC|nr:MarR family transcriptional regulator [Prevotella sp. oral taxon 313]PTL29810.1 MarR family transcriptional regulator [Prevotella sp. oral taxon 313]